MGGEVDVIGKAKHHKHIVKLSLHKVLVEVTCNEEMLTGVLEEHGIQIGG